MAGKTVASEVLRFKPLRSSVSDAEWAWSSISRWPRRIEHHSLCSATGMPHSTHTRTRGFGGSVFPSSRFSRDMNPPGSPTNLETLDGPAGFMVGASDAGLHAAAQAGALDS